MLTVEVRVNGNLVAELQALNITPPFGEDLTVCDYRYGGSTHPPGAGQRPITFAGEVEHIRDDGVLKLVRIILEDIE